MFMKWGWGRGRGALAIPMSPQFAISLVNFPTLNLECNALIWFSHNNQILKTLVRSFHFLFPGTHKPKSWASRLW